MGRDMTTTGPTLATPPFTNDYLGREQLLPGGAKLDASQFLPLSAVVVTTPGGAALGATTITVSALSGPIPNNTILDWTGTGEYSRLTSAAVAGATVLNVEALDAAIEAGDTATYAGTGRTMVPGGTVVGRTIAERNASTGFGPAAAADDEIYVIAFDVDDATKNADVELIRPNAGVTLKENYLPGFSALAAGVVTLLRARYICIRGAA